MPRRYEEPDCREFAKPRAGTWIALNKALGYDIPDETLAALAQEEPTNSTDMDTPSTVPGVIKALTLAEAKAGLAITFGVNIDQIEITIRG